MNQMDEETASAFFFFQIQLWEEIHVAKSIAKLWKMFQEDPTSLKKDQLIRLIEDIRGSSVIEAIHQDEDVNISHKLTEKILVGFFFNGEKPTDITEKQFSRLVRTLCANTGITMADGRHIDELERFVQDAMVEGAFDETIEQIRRYDAHLAQKISNYTKKQQNKYLNS